MRERRVAHILLAIYRRCPYYYQARRTRQTRRMLGLRRLFMAYHGVIQRGFLPLALLFLCFCVLPGCSSAPKDPDAIEKIAFSPHVYPDGRKVFVMLVFGNNTVARAAVIAQHSAESLKRGEQVLYGPNTYTLKGLNTQVLIRGDGNAASAQTGIWVNGEKEKLGPDLEVLYVSDKSAVKKIIVPSNYSAQFIADICILDPMAVIEKWIKVR